MNNEMKSMKNRVVFLIFVMTAIFSACRPATDKVQIKIERLEQYLDSIPTDSIATSVPQLQRRYGELLDLYSLRVIGIGAPEDPQYAERLIEFLTDAYMCDAYRKVTEMYPDLKEIERDLSDAFTRYREAFPERVIPSVYTLISGFNQSMIVADTILAIALDKYLGPDEEMYSALNLARYRRHVMDRKYIAADCMRAWIGTEFPNGAPEDNVLNNILYEGKIAYSLRKVLPDMPDSLLFGFTPDRMRWCENNTRQMWTFLVENRLLYATDPLTISKLVAPAPFCPFFTGESPGRAAVWLGYRIIVSYMEHNKVTLRELMQDNDYREILARAKFKP